MNNKRRAAVITAMAAAACILSACSLGGKKPAEQVIVEETPTPEPTATPEPTPTIAPDAQSTTYTSKDKLISIELPDATWANKADQPDMVSFEAPDDGKILIMHASGDDMNSTVLPDSEDMANSLEKASGYVDGTDYILSNYSLTEGDSTVITYNVKYMNTDKSEGVLETINKVFVNDNEYFSIVASLKKDDEKLRTKILDSLASLKVIGESSLKDIVEATLSQAPAETPAAAEASETEATGGEIGESMRNNYTDEQLADTSQTRTIYRNSDGKALVIVPKDDEGNWTDEAGNTYHFTSESDVYDQNDVDFYYHGEAGDVYFMPVE